MAEVAKGTFLFVHRLSEKIGPREKQHPKSIRFTKIIPLSLLALCLSVPQLSMGEDLGRYRDADGYARPLNDLGRQIARTQRLEVWPGHNEYDCYTTADAVAFRHDHKLQALMKQFAQSSAFKPGVTALRNLNASKRSYVLNRWLRRNFLTWAENGHIGDDGTTVAGSRIETVIAQGCVRTVRAALGKGR